MSPVHFKSLIATVLLVCSGQADAATSPYVFGGTGVDASDAILVINGSDRYFSRDTGWYIQTGAHGSANQNYITGRLDYLNQDYKSYFAFDLRTLAATMIDSVTLMIRNGSANSTLPVTLNMYDVITSRTVLDQNRQDGDLEGLASYNDLGTGQVYGSTMITPASVQDPYTSVSLNSLFVSRLLSGPLSDVVLGGSIEPQASGAVPEPASWALMIVGFGAVGGAMRRRKSKVTTKVAFA